MRSSNSSTSRIEVSSRLISFRLPEFAPGGRRVCRGGVFDGLTDARGGEFKQVQVLRREVVDLLGLNVDDAD